MKEAKIDEIPEYKKYVCLTFNKVKVKEGLVYNRESMEIIGFVNIGDISEHLHAYERSSTKILIKNHKLLRTYLCLWSEGSFLGFVFHIHHFHVHRQVINYTLLYGSVSAI